MPTTIGPHASAKEPATRPFTIRLLASSEDLYRIAPEWLALFHSDPQSTPFQSPDWLIPWWEHVGEGELHCLAARGQFGALLAFLPLYIYTQPTTGERHLLLLGAGTSDYLGGLFCPDDGSALALALLQYLASSRHAPLISDDAGLSGAPHIPAWDKAFLAQLRTESPLLLQSKPAGWSVFDAEPCSLIHVTGRQHLSSKLRGNLSRYARRAHTEGSLGLRLASTPDEAAAALECLIDLHTRRWQGRGEPGVLASPAVQAHHRAAVPRLQAAGMLHMAELRLNEHTIAVLYALRDESGRALRPGSSALFLYLMGFDPAFADLSPGTLLLGAVFDRCGETSIPAMDLLRGGETYKELWGAHTVPTFGITLPG